MILNGDYGAQMDAIATSTSSPFHPSQFPQISGSDLQVMEWLTIIKESALTSTGGFYVESKSCSSRWQSCR